MDRDRAIEMQATDCLAWVARQNKIIDKHDIEEKFAKEVIRLAEIYKGIHEVYPGWFTVTERGRYLLGEISAADGIEGRKWPRLRGWKYCMVCNYPFKGIIRSVCPTCSKKDPSITYKVTDNVSQTIPIGTGVHEIIQALRELAKDEHGLMELIESIVRPIHKGLDRAINGKPYIPGMENTA